MKRIMLLLLAALLLLPAAAASIKPVTRVLFIGDSMTGWLSERLEAYGAENGFEVTTVTWDGSTPAKWAKTGKLTQYINQYKPDVIFINLGMNQLLDRNPSKSLAAPMATLLKSVGSIPLVWIGPLEWPGKGKGEALVNYLKKTVEAAPNGHFYNASDLQIPRQSKTNPHPTRDGSRIMVDHIVKWLPTTGIPFKSLNAPKGEQMKRGKVFIYKRMNQPL
ncbi:MAG: SGNH/GDSL hydrolase family protein [Muribaculaceae bacterium]|nr:SGNH/GDSL hydrolase family protein [Muribaculaceae bacterium]